MLRIAPVPKGASGINSSSPHQANQTSQTTTLQHAPHASPLASRPPTGHTSNHPPQPMTTNTKHLLPYSSLLATGEETPAVHNHPPTQANHHRPPQLPGPNQHPLTTPHQPNLPDHQPSNNITLHPKVFPSLLCRRLYLSNISPIESPHFPLFAF